MLVSGRDDFKLYFIAEEVPLMLDHLRLGFANAAKRALLFSWAPESGRGKELQKAK
jgi:hypothetical protein